MQIHRVGSPPRPTRRHPVKETSTVADTAFSTDRTAVATGGASPRGIGRREVADRPASAAQQVFDEPAHVAVPGVDDFPADLFAVAPLAPVWVAAAETVRLFDL